MQFDVTAKTVYLNHVQKAKSKGLSLKSDATFQKLNGVSKWCISTWAWSRYNDVKLFLTMFEGAPRVEATAESEFPLALGSSGFAFTPAFAFTHCQLDWSIFRRDELKNNTLDALNLRPTLCLVCLAMFLVRRGRHCDTLRVGIYCLDIYGEYR